MKRKTKVYIHQSESAVLLSVMLIVTYRCYKDKHFYTESTSAGDEVLSHITVIGKGQDFQLFKSSWAVFYTGRELASCVICALHKAVVITAWHILVSPPEARALPSFCLSLCPQDELWRSFLKQFWELSQVNILPFLHHGSLQNLIDYCARNSQPTSTPFMLAEFKLLFQRQIYLRKKYPKPKKAWFWHVYTHKKTLYLFKPVQSPHYSHSVVQLAFFLIGQSKYVWNII